jgi:hypothetical protein
VASLDPIGSIDTTAASGNVRDLLGTTDAAEVAYDTAITIRSTASATPS